MERTEEIDKYEKMSYDEEKRLAKLSQSEPQYKTVEQRALNHYQAMVILNPKDYRQYVKLGDALCLQ